MVGAGGEAVEGWNAAALGEGGLVGGWRCGGCRIGCWGWRGDNWSH